MLNKTHTDYNYALLEWMNANIFTRVNYTDSNIFCNIFDQRYTQVLLVLIFVYKICVFVVNLIPALFNLEF